MVDIQYIRALLSSWSKLVPKFRFDTYSYATAGIEFTWRQGVGIGLGLGSLDVWVGWPRNQKSLHHPGCGHNVIADVVEPVGS